jgi:hypothetical protein
MPLLLLAALAAAPPDSKLAVSFGVGYVVPDAKQVFVPAKGGGVEALDLDTGKALWVNKDANHVAGASDKLVLAWVAEPKKANSFRVVVIDAATGKTVTKSEPVEMPEWATTAKVGGRSFRTGAWTDGDKVAVAWQANAFYFGGARPTPEIEATARKEAAGVVAIDPKTGKVTAENRKPRDSDFGTFGNKVGGFEFRVTEEIPGFKPGAAMVTKVTLGLYKGEREIWTRELAGNPWSPPPP